MSRPDTAAGTASGYAFALGAFGIWALFPLFWNLLEGVPAPEILAHRALWTIPVCALALAVTGRLHTLYALLGDRRTLAFLALSTALITSNWGTYIWAVTSGHVLDASMGYFLNPLMNVVAGLVLFRERLRPLQWTAVALAGAGVAAAALAAGQMPWVGLLLACSFAGYGAVRKLIDVPALPGLLAETLILLPLAGGYALWLGWQGTGHFLVEGPATDILLVLAGAITALPLLFYVGGARRLPMATMGMLFYLTPTGLFLLATLLYGEPVTLADGLSFGMIWLGLAVFTVDLQRNARRKMRATAV